MFDATKRCFSSHTGQHSGFSHCSGGTQTVGWAVVLAVLMATPTEPTRIFSCTFFGVAPVLTRMPLIPGLVATIPGFHAIVLSTVMALIMTRWRVATQSVTCPGSVMSLNCQVAASCAFQISMDFCRTNSRVPGSFLLMASSAMPRTIRSLISDDSASPNE